MQARREDLEDGFCLVKAGISTGDINEAVHAYTIEHGAIPAR